MYMNRHVPLLLLLGLLLLSGCIPPFFFLDCAPSKCKEAKEGFAHSQPVIAALDAYRQEHGGYPDNLNALVPRYIPAVPEQIGDRDLRLRARSRLV